MEGFDHKHNDKHDLSGAADISSATHSHDSKHNSKGSLQDAGFVEELDKTLEARSAKSSKADDGKKDKAPASAPDDHNHAKPEGAGKRSLHISLDEVDVLRNLDVKKVGIERSLAQDVGNNGDFLIPGSGTNTVIGSGDKDVILGTDGGFNTITTGTGEDSIILGLETTNRVFDFDPAKDKILFATDIDLNNVVIAQGKNPGKGGLDQPLDSVSNALIIDKSTEHILASLTFVNASSLNEDTMTQLEATTLDTLNEVNFSVKEGKGQLNGTKQHDKLVGDKGDNFLYVGDDGFKFNAAKGIDEFPFPTDSPGSSELNAELKGGTFRVNGTYKDFDGLPLFSQGEKEIDPNAKILNGSDPKALVDGFLQVPKDVEGNKISGTHLHFSPAGDDRGNFADATVVRFFENTPNDDKKSGSIKGEFKLTSEEQAALLAGTLYANIHTNIDGDGDGRAGFPTGENRINFNKDVVQFTV